MYNCTHGNTNRHTRAHAYSAVHMLSSITHCRIHPHSGLRQEGQTVRVFSTSTTLGGGRTLGKLHTRGVAVTVARCGVEVALLAAVQVGGPGEADVEAEVVVGAVGRVGDLREGLAAVHEARVAALARVLHALLAVEVRCVFTALDVQSFIADAAQVVHCTVIGVSYHYDIIGRNRARVQRAGWLTQVAFRIYFFRAGRVGGIKELAVLTLEGEVAGSAVLQAHVVTLAVGRVGNEESRVVRGFRWARWGTRAVCVDGQCVRLWSRQVEWNARVKRYTRWTLGGREGRPGGRECNQSSRLTNSIQRADELC